MKRGKGAMRGRGTSRWEAVTLGEVMQQLAGLEAREAMMQQEVEALAGGRRRRKERHMTTIWQTIGNPE